MTRPLLAPRRLRPGDTIGVFTPSAPGYAWGPELFDTGVRTLQTLGFEVKLGSLTAARRVQGHRSGTPRERADELMELVADDRVQGLVATIGGSNSSSLIPYLDFDRIRHARKVICGFSDVTSLHLATLRHAGLRTLYGPALMTWFGEWPGGDAVSIASWSDAVVDNRGERVVAPPARWSNHRRRWDNGDWKTRPREWRPNPGWQALSPGVVEAPIVAANLNTLVSAAGTPHWPDLDGVVLLIEEMDAPLARTERHLRHLQLLGVFDQIAGLIFSKPEVPDEDASPLGYAGLLAEIVGARAYPIVSDFDCGHTLPMITVPERVRVRVSAAAAGPVEFRFLEPACEG